MTDPKDIVQAYAFGFLLMGYFLIGLVLAIILNRYLVPVIRRLLSKYLVERWPASGTPRTSHVTALLSDGAAEPGVSELVTK